MSKNIVYEGWLTKSPPSKRIWKTKWRRRWFALRQSGELPGQYFLDYYADYNCRRLKGTINLDFCEQVDAGLHMERTNQGAPVPNIRGSVFTIQTQTRTYHLEAECESDMEKWVDAICSVCGLRPTEEIPSFAGIYQNHLVAVDNQQNTRRNSNVATPMVNGQNSSASAANNVNYATIASNDQQNASVSHDQDIAIALPNDQYDCGESTGPYIPISECITGVRAPDTQRAFTFDPKNIVTSTKMFDKSDASNNFKSHSYHGNPQIRVNNVAVELSENDSNSEDECRSLNASQYNIGEVTVSKSFTRLNLNQQRNNGTMSDDGPPVPPRPPKTFALTKEVGQRESFHGPKVQEPKAQEAIEFQENSPFPWVRLPRPAQQHTAPSSPGRAVISHCVRTTDDEEDAPVGHSMQYCNLSVLPPAVDRALKPRRSSHSIGNTYNYNGSGGFEEPRQDVLQYLDLDLHVSTPSTSNSHDPKRATIIHGKSNSSAEADSAYKTVDFLKTEAFNITRQDAEASRSVQQ